MASHIGYARSDRGRLWALGGASAAGLCLLAYGTGAFVAGVHPGNGFGLAYGVLATALMLASAGYALRRRTVALASRLGLGRARSWLWLHLWAGALFLLLLEMHIGFRLPVGGLTTTLWLVAWWTVLSGAAGLGLQQWIPKVMGSALAVEAIYERIPELVGDLRERAETLSQEGGDALLSLYRRRVADAMAAPRRDPRYFLDPAGRIQSRLGEFEYTRRFVEGDEKERLEELERLFRTKLELDAHYTLQTPLRLWLPLHVPPSLLLVALVAVHVFTVVYW